MLLRPFDCHLLTDFALPQLLPCWTTTRSLVVKCVTCQICQDDPYAEDEHTFDPDTQHVYDLKGDSVQSGKKE